MDVNQITVPPNTPEQTPVGVDMLAGARYLRYGEIYFVPGCRGAVGVRIRDHGRQIFPLSGWVFGDNKSFPFGPLILEGPNYELTAELFSNASDYDQIVIISIDVRTTG